MNIMIFWETRSPEEVRVLGKGRKKKVEVCKKKD